MPLVDVQLDELTLRTLAPRDAEAVFAAVEANRDRLRLWFPWVDDTVTAADSLKFIEATLAESHNGLTWAAAVWRDGRLVGHLGIHERNSRCQRSELGYWVCRSVEGDGLCTRATRALLNEALSSGRLHKVILHADTGNAPSNRVATKLGFVREGTLIQQDWNPGRQEWRDLHVYGLLAAHWRSQ